jgi:hypothetical protein
MDNHALLDAVMNGYGDEGDIIHSRFRSGGHGKL